MEKLSKEKAVLGVYVSGHPFEKFLPYFKDKTFNCSMLNDYEEDEETGLKKYAEISDGMQVTMGGMIGAFKKLKTRSGSFMAFVTVEDMSGSIECVCFPKIYDKVRNFLEADRVVSLSGKISIEEEKLPVIILDKMDEFILDEAGKQPQAKQAQYAEREAAPRQNIPVLTAQAKQDERKLWLNVSALEEEDIEELLDTLSFYVGETQVYFVKDGKKMMCTQKVSPNKALFAELATFLPENCIKFI